MQAIPSKSKCESEGEKSKSEVKKWQYVRKPEFLSP